MAAECITAKNTQCRVTCLAVYSDADYRQAIRAKQLEVIAGRASKTKRPIQEEEEEKYEEKYKPVTKKKKKVRIQETEEEEEEEETGETLLEVVKGAEALEMLGLGDQEENGPVKRSKRKNKGKPAKRLDEDSD